MSRGGGNGKKRNSTRGRGSNNTTHDSNSTPEHHPMSSPIEDSNPNTPSNAHEYTSESSKREIHGSNTTQDMAARSLHKTFLIPLGNVFHVQGVSSVIREILIGMFDGNWPTWKKVPKHNQDLMWERFQSKFEWAPEHDTKVEANWKFLLKRRYRDLMRDSREDAFRLARENGVIVGNDWSVLKPYHPAWIDARNWASMIDDCWNTERWQRNSAKNKVNRSTLVDGKMAGHSGGSRSMIHTQLFLEKEKGGPVPFIKVYETFFTKRKREPSDPQEFTNPKAKNVLDEYNRLMVEEFGSDKNEHPDEIVPTLWEKACGGMKKGNLFGATKDILAMAGGALKNCSQYGSQNEEVESLKEELKRQKKVAEKAEQESAELKIKVAELQEREQARELKMSSLEDQMKLVTQFMKSQGATN